MKIIQDVAPTVEPLTIEELSMHLRIDDETAVENEYLEDLIVGARIQAENVTRRKFLTQTYSYYLDGFPTGNFLKLPFGNLQSVVSVKYKDSDGDETTMTVTTDYIVQTSGWECGGIVLPYGVTWPSFTPYPSNPITIQFVCGWTTRSLIPQPIKNAMKLICADMYVNRESQVLVDLPGQQYLENKTADNLLINYKLWDSF